MRRIDIRRGLYVLGIVFVVPLVWFNESSLGGGDNRSTKVTLGLPFSPWFRYESSFVKQEWGEGPIKSFTISEHSGWGIELVSWSSLCFVLALCCFIFAKSLKPRSATVPVQPPQTEGQPP